MHFGRGFDAAIRASPEAVAAAAKVPVEIALDLQRIWIANSDFNTAMAYLSAFGLTHHQVTTLVGKFGSQVVPILENDPYVLMREITGYRLQTGRQDRPQDGHAEGSAIADSRGASLQRAGRAR